MKKFSYVLALTLALIPGELSAQTNSGMLSASAPPRAIFKTADAAAQKLYGAWRAKDKAGAGAAADREAVEKLFSVRRRAMKFEGCQKREEGDFECIYRDARNDISLAMLAAKTLRGYRIKSLSFSTEAM